MRQELCEDALRLGRILAELEPEQPEVHGLVALMEINASRSASRTGPTGEPVLLLDQDRSRWDQLLIRRGLAALDRVDELKGSHGPYALQARITACHALARAPGDADWAQIAALYGELAELTRPGGPPPEARPPRRGPTRVRARRVARSKRAPAPAPPRPSRRLRAGRPAGIREVNCAMAIASCHPAKPSLQGKGGEVEANRSCASSWVLPW
ncbi:MAG TPA: DUF6596 domain-containing protein [Polyangiaceae bacterium]|nr:DUF6596 domain-containing protein [Polyangiaceae bacterium]